MFKLLVGLSNWTMGVMCPYFDLRNETVSRRVHGWDESSRAQQDMPVRERTNQSFGTSLNSLRRGEHSPPATGESDSDGSTQNSMDETNTEYYTPNS